MIFKKIISGFLPVGQRKRFVPFEVFLALQASPYVAERVFRLRWIIQKHKSLESLEYFNWIKINYSNSFQRKRFVQFELFVFHKENSFSVLCYRFSHICLQMSCFIYKFADAKFVHWHPWHMQSRLDGQSDYKNGLNRQARNRYTINPHATSFNGLARGTTYLRRKQ